MGILRGLRRPGLPDQAARLLGIARDERVLAWSALEGGGWAAATMDRLHLVTPRGQRLARSWVDVDHAAWDLDSRTLAVWWVGSRQVTPLEVDERSFLPEVVNERVRASVVATTDVPVGAGRVVRVALRKASDGELNTQVVAPPGVRLDDPEVDARVTAATRLLRQDAGLR